ncbi:AAA family ATPase [Scytonema sp. UIC 10036]|uniref:ATP-binding protein n=1 Tax=Scytonema sp. UIC 10036 TaxID=2304196 RepID=UPI0012DA9DA0|nr:ATP-binding protein [Scytonema sp. UIC 10036]MUG99456.1 AAA family ATPase [Scytonema sp. UIC 10036]
MRKRKLIFVGGVHGVGKTTLCKEIESKFHVKHFSASNLISREKQEEHLLNKLVEKIGENQDILLTAINKYFKNENWYLLDGHFCLLNKDNEITKIPESTYDGICPNAILLLVDKPEDIYARLSSRDSIKHDLALLKYFQEQEIGYAEYISGKLNIPYLIYHLTESKNKVYTFIESLVTQAVSE